MSNLEKKVEHLYRTISGPVHRFILRSIRDEAIAGDILQDTFVNFYKVFQNRDLPGSDEECRMYLFRTARNLIINHERSYYNRNVRRAPSTEDISIADTSEKSPELSYLEQETDERTKKEVKALLETLDESERTVILLRYYSDLSYQEIADVIGMTLSSTYRLARKAEKKLKEESQKRGFSGREVTAD